MTSRSSKGVRAAGGFLAGLLLSCTAPDPQHTMVEMVEIERLNPPGMHSNPAFSQAICVQGVHRTLYIGGQNAVDEAGQIVGPGDVAAQAAQVARNFKAVLDAVQASPEAIVKWTVHIVDGQELLPAMKAFQQELAGPAEPATVTVFYVSGLAHPDFLIEIDGIAVLPPSEG